jgi:hypothetical protein
MNNQRLSSGCHSYSQSLTRRQLLQVGGLSLLDVHLPGLLRAAERGSKHKARARAVIFLYQWGGPSHHDSFDMKPSAAEAIRGEFKPIASNVPGVSICERLPSMAGVMNKVTLERSLHHTMKNHNSAGYYGLSGYAL